MAITLAMSVEHPIHRLIESYRISLERRGLVNAWNFCSINELPIIVVGAERLRRVAPIIEGFDFMLKQGIV